MNIDEENKLPEDFKNYENNNNAGEEELNEIFEKIKRLSDSDTEEEPAVAQETQQVEGDEENLDTEPESEPEGLEEEIEPEKKPKKKEPSWKLKRDKFKILADNKALMEQLSSEREQKEELKRLLEESLYSGNYHFEQSTRSALEKAKAKQREAVQKGDTELFLDSNIEIYEALNTLNEIKKAAFTGSQPPERENNYQRANYDPYQNNQYNNYPQKESYPSSDRDDINQQLVDSWLEKHDYLQSDSEEFDPKLYKQVMSYSKVLYDTYDGKQRDKYVFSKEYFKELDNHIKDLRRISAPAKSADTGAPIGGVKNSYYSPARNKPALNKNPELNAIEKMIAENLKDVGVTEDKWRRYKGLQLKTMNGRR